MRLKVSTYGGIALAHAGAPLAALALRRRRACTRTRSGTPIPFVAQRARAVRPGRRHRLLDPAEGARVPHRHRRRRPRHRLLADQVLPADHLHDAGLRRRLRVPDPPRRSSQLAGDPRRPSSCAVSAATPSSASPCSWPSSRRPATRSACSPYRSRCLFYEVVDPHRPARARATERATRRRDRATSTGRVRRRSSSGSRSRSTRSSSRPSTPSTPASRCWSPRRRGRARRSSPSTPSTWRWPAAARPSTRRRSRRCRTRSSATSCAASAPSGSACSPATTPSTATPRWW